MTCEIMVCRNCGLAATDRPVNRLPYGATCGRWVCAYASWYRAQHGTEPPNGDDSGAADAWSAGQQQQPAKQLDLFGGAS